MLNRLGVFLLVSIVVVGAVAQKQMKPWTEWTKKDVQKILSDSAWAQSQTEFGSASRASGSAISSTTAAAGINTDRSRDPSSTPDPMIKYFVRLLSAKPIRQALARNIELDQASANPQLAEQLRAFVEKTPADYIIVTVSAESNDRALGTAATQALKAATTDVLKDVTYLERKDGQRLALAEYRVPGNDGFGARFVFPRMLNGKPFVDADAGQLRFYAELSKKVKLNLKFKVSEMSFEGNLEY